MTWYVKVNHYSGGESVVAVKESKEDAQSVADLYNHQYQSTNYYIEAYDPDKVWVWPTRKQMKDLLKLRKELDGRP